MSYYVTTEEYNLAVKSFIHSVSILKQNEEACSMEDLAGKFSKAYSRMLQNINNELLDVYIMISFAIFPFESKEDYTLFAESAKESLMRPESSAKRQKLLSCLRARSEEDGGYAVVRTMANLADKEKYTEQDRIRYVQYVSAKDVIKDGKVYNPAIGGFYDDEAGGWVDDHGYFLLFDVYTPEGKLSNIA